MKLTDILAQPGKVYRFDEISQWFAHIGQLAEMNQHLKNTARGCCGVKKNRLMPAAISNVKIDKKSIPGPASPIAQIS